MCAKRRITQHKRFVPYGTHPNFCFAKLSFMLGTLYAIGLQPLVKSKNLMIDIVMEVIRNGRYIA